MAIADLSAEALRIYFRYNPDTGEFFRFYDNKPTGRITTNGYRQIFVFGKRYMAHRLAWLYMYGEWPEDQLDHINQVRDDNRIANLRPATNKQNGENIRKFKHNTSGRSGVRWVSRRGAWEASIRHHKKLIHLGTHPTIIDAVAARIRAERELFTHSPDYPQNYARAAGSRIEPRGSTATPGTK